MPLLRNSKQLKASSVLESVIAISIISICALVAFTIYLNVITQHRSTYYFNAKHKIDFLALQAIQDKDYEDDFYTYNGYTINKTVSVNISKQTALLVFTFKIIDRTYVVNKIILYNEY